MKNFLTLLLSVLTCTAGNAQFAPQVGIPGCDAISSGAPAIKAWASKCSIIRGRLDIADLSSGYTVVGDSTSAMGVADGTVVSLGDSGIAIIQFDAPLLNGPGPDLAVFENGFANPANAEEAFLELAFVEVSSDGNHYFRFPAVSNTPLTAQVKGSGDYMNARYINNLAGKYTSRNGTPFDLEELKDEKGLDINNITHIRIIDVIGDIGIHSSRDKNGSPINDPYPTPFLTGGFDLDAVAALNKKAAGIGSITPAQVAVYPNPATDLLQVNLQEYVSGTTAVLTDLAGHIVLQTALQQQASLSLSSLQPGLYFLHIIAPEGTLWTGKISKY